MKTKFLICFNKIYATPPPGPLVKNFFVIHVPSKVMMKGWNKLVEWHPTARPGLNINMNIYMITISRQGLNINMNIYMITISRPGLNINMNTYMKLTAWQGLQTTLS